MGNDLIKRIGHFHVNGDAIDDHPADIMAIMGRMIVTRCEYLYNRNVFAYEAMSFLFRELSRGDKVPEYTMTVSKDGTVSAVEAVDEREG